MSLLQRIAEIDRKFAWSFVGVVLAMAFGAVSLYPTIYPKQVRISHELIAESNVFDIHRPVEGLAISFKGEDLEKRNLGLRVLKLRIRNTGELDVLQSMYDSLEPWGFVLTGSQIVESRIAEASSPYLLKNARATVVGANAVEFQKLILEPNQFFVIETLYTYPKDKLPAIEPTGKIAGVDSFRITPASPIEAPSVWSQSFGGNAVVHAVRLVAYPALFAVVMAMCFVPIVLIGEKVSDARRRKRIDRVFEQTKLARTPRLGDSHWSLR